MLTLFSCPKAFHGHISVIQRNAIKSWSLLHPKPEIILLGDDAGIAEICREFRLVHIPDIEKNDYGTPLVSSIFKTGQEAAIYSVVCYINADILLMSDFMQSVETIAAHTSNYLMIGRRWDVDINEQWDFLNPDWEKRLKFQSQKNGKLHAPTGIDYYVFPREFDLKIPPFAVGRFTWDNWIVFRARELGTPVIDATSAVMAIHQNHDYSHLLASRPALFKGPEESINRSLVSKGFINCNVDYATLVLRGEKLRPALAPKYVIRRLFFIPGIGWLLRLAKRWKDKGYFGRFRARLQNL
jgi:hypothetical protein